MTYEDMKIGMKVYDSWWPSWGKGDIIVISKTIVKIKFKDGIKTYDVPHLRFLGEA